MSIKNFDYIIGNGTRDLPACSTVSQSTAPPRANCLLVPARRHTHVKFMRRSKCPHTCTTNPRCPSAQSPLQVMYGACVHSTSVSISALSSLQAIIHTHTHTHTVIISSEDTKIPDGMPIHRSYGPEGFLSAQ
jgi:hypothetical protein